VPRLKVTSSMAVLGLLTSKNHLRNFLREYLSLETRLHVHMVCVYPCLVCFLFLYTDMLCTCAT
jgi:hypothetical protein